MSTSTSCFLLKRMKNLCLSSEYLTRKQEQKESKLYVNISQHAYYIAGYYFLLYSISNGISPA